MGLESVRLDQADPASGPDAEEGAEENGPRQ